MSSILRFSLKYALRSIGTNPSRIRGRTILKPAFPSFKPFISNYHGQKQLVKRFNNPIEYVLTKLDSDARRFGRVTLRDVQRVLDEVKKIGSLSTSQSLTIIRCCGSLLGQEKPETRTKLVQEIWETSKVLGVERDISHYNALLRVYNENEYPFDPEGILADLEKEGLEPNRVTYQQFIFRYCLQGDTAGASRILQIMRQKEMPINIYIFNALILGHSQANDMQSADGILTIMEEAGIQPTSETFTLLICGHIKQNNLEKVEEIMRNCALRDIQLREKDYMDIIYAYAIQGHVNEIDKILDKMMKTVTYNQEASNLSLKLISVGKLEEAFKVLKSIGRSYRDDGAGLPLGDFFINYLIKCDASADDILKYCLQMMKENINPFALRTAMHCSLQLGKDKLALILFKAAKENNLPVKFHYFWPLLVLRGKKNDTAGMLEVLSTMYTDFGITPNSETVREYVIPFMLKENTNIENLVASLRGCGVTISCVIASAVIHLLMKGEIKRAAVIAESYGAYYPVYLIRKPLVSSFLSTEDVDSFVRLLRAISIGIDWYLKSGEKMKDEDLDVVSHDYREYSGQILVDAVKSMAQRNSFSKLNELFQQLRKYEVGISVKSAKTILDVLRNECSPELTALIHTLSSSELASPPSQIKNPKISYSLMDIESLNRLKDVLKAKGEFSTHINKQLFFAYARDKNLEKLLEIKRELDEADFLLTKGMYSYLIDTFLECDKVDEAMNVYEQLREKDPDFNLNSTKLLKLALHLVQRGLYDKALEILKTKPNDREVKDIIEEGVSNNVFGRKILDIFAEEGDVQRVKEFLDVLLSNGLVDVANILLGPTVKVHLKRNDLDAAIKEFENCALKYKTTPWKNELCRVLIENEDAANLQKITDLSTQIHGESNVLYDLMFTFLESGRFKHAQKIMQIPGLRIRHDRLLSACKKYSDEGTSEHLLNLLALTNGIHSVNRNEIYYHALLVFSKANDTKQALALWTQMQEEDVQPTDEFLIILSEILIRNNQPVPFSVPVQSTQAISREYGKQRVGSLSSQLRKLINSGNIDEALKLKNRSNPEQLSVADWSLLIEACTKENRYADAKNLLNEYYSKTGALPVSKIMKTFLTVAMKVPDVEIFEYFSSRLSNDLKQRLSFDNHRCRAYLNANRTDEFLTELENSLSNAKSKEEFDAYVEAFPRGGILTVTAEKPEYVPRVEKLLRECLERDRNCFQIANTLWIQYMITKRYKDADEVFKTFLLNSDSPISFRRLTNHVIRNRDTELGQKIVEVMESSCSNITPAALGVAYGALISAHVQKGSPEEALKVLDRALSKVELSDIIRSSLFTLKLACSSRNLEFPYEIPTVHVDTTLEYDATSQVAA